MLNTRGMERQKKEYFLSLEHSTTWGQRQTGLYSVAKGFVRDVGVSGYDPVAKDPTETPTSPLY